MIKKYLCGVLLIGICSSGISMDRMILRAPEQVRPGDPVLGLTGQQLITYAQLNLTPQNGEFVVVVDRDNRPWWMPVRVSTHHEEGLTKYTILQRQRASGAQKMYRKVTLNMLYALVQPVARTIDRGTSENKENDEPMDFHWAYKQ